MGVAKPLTKDLTVSFERKFDPLHRDNTEQVILDYKVNKLPERGIPDGTPQHRRGRAV